MARVSRLAALLVSLALFACGGGGGGGGSSGALTLSKHTLVFAAPDTGSTPPPQTVTATISGDFAGKTVYVRIIANGLAIGSVSDIQFTSSTSGQANIYPAEASTRGPGVYNGTITITACTSDIYCNSGLIGTPQTIDVAYTVNGVAASTNALSYGIGNSPAAVDMARESSVTGYPVQSWTASVDVPWLSLSTASGNTASAAALSATLVDGEIAAMNNGTYTGTLTISPQLGSPVAIPVQLTIARTQASFVSPYVATSGTSGKVIIRGENFNQVTISGVKFGSSDATEFSVVSDTEITATYPGVTAGSYDVHLLNSEGIDRTMASLKVVDAPGYAAGTIAYPDATAKRVIGLAYDAERKALLVGILYPSSGTAGNKLLRYSYGGSWSGATTKGVADLSALALSTNGQELLAASRMTVTELDPVTLMAGTVTSYPNLDGSQYIDGFGIINDGGAVALTSAYGSGDSPAVRYRTRPARLEMLGGYDFYRGNICGSRDGSVVYMGSTFSGGYLYKYNSSSGTLASTGAYLNAVWISTDDTGSIVLLNKTKVYDQSITLLGSLPDTTLASVLSPAGTRAYTYDSNGKLRAFDLTATPVAGEYPELGSGVALAGNPGAGINGSDMQMVITPDGGTLFLAGSNQVVIQPAP